MRRPRETWRQWDNDYAAAMRREVSYYHRRRAELILAITGAVDLAAVRCMACGRDPGDISRFHIDHVNGRAYDLRKLGSHNRIAQLWREWGKGTSLRVLCDKCNTTDGNDRRWKKKK